MAMTKCRECGAQISTEAKACLQCGATPPKKTSTFTWLIAGFIVFAAYIAVTTPGAPPAPALTPAQQAANQKHEQEFQRVVAVAKLVKRSAKNPDSFKLTFAGLTDKGAICIEYRATNSFNAVVPGRFIATRQASGDTAALWNQHCANQPMTDYTHARQAL